MTGPRIGSMFVRALAGSGPVTPTPPDPAHDAKLRDAARCAFAAAPMAVAVLVDEWEREVDDLRRALAARTPPPGRSYYDCGRAPCRHCPDPLRRTDDVRD